MGWQHHARRAHRWFWYAVAGVLIAMALVAGAVSQLLPLAERHPDAIARWLSERAGYPVSFDRVATQWTRRGPLLRLENLRIGEGASALRMGDAEMLVSQYTGLLPGHSFTVLRIHGLDLALERGSDGRWSVRGLPGQQSAGGDPLARLQRLGELQVVDARLAVHAPDLGIDVAIPRAALRLRVDGARVVAGLRAWMRTDAMPVDAVLDFDRKRGSGRGWVSAQQVRLDAWSALLHEQGIAVAGGTGDAQAWLDLADHRVNAIDVHAALRDLVLSGTPLQAGSAPTRAEFDNVLAALRWQALAGGWRIDAPQLRVSSGGKMQSLDGLLVAGGQRYALVADRIDVGPLLRAAALSDQVAPGLRRWLTQAAPVALLSKVEVAGARGGALRARGRIDGLGFAPVGNAPGLHGLAGDIAGDAQGMHLRFDPRNRFDFDWPRGFGVVHPVVLDGIVAGWRDADGWRVDTRALHVAGTDYSADIRGGMTFQSDGSRPFIDLAATLGDAPATAAKKFWVRDMMSPAALQWLDAAFIGGTVHNGRAVVVGDLDDWPFAAHNGLFEADGELRGVAVKFQPDWPQADKIDGAVSFVSDGFSAHGTAELAGVGMQAFDAGIAHFGKADLTVHARASSDAAKLLALLRQSPLRKTYGDTLDNIDASGPTTVTFALDLPLHDNQPGTLGGDVSLAGARLSEKRYDLAFDNVRGNATYGQDGFAAERLDVVRNGLAGKLSLRAGGDVRDAGNAFEADLQATLDADDLLQRAPDMTWLKPYVDGRSLWSIGVALPRSAGAQAAAPTALRLTSNLVGTRLALPDPLAKPASAALPTSVQVALPLGQGDVAVAFGDRVALRARGGGAQTGVRVVLGSDRVIDAPPASGLVVSGATDALDALDWIALLHGSGGSSGGLPLRAIDVSAARLRMIGSVFPQTRLRVVPTAGGNAVRFDGAALSGALQIPAADRAPITGQLQRVYWRSATPSPAPGITSAAPADSGGDIDPAAIPPLQLSIDDMRFGDMPLGQLTLRTQAVPAGMHIAQLQTRAPRQAFDVSGDWLGRGNAARTRMTVHIASQDFGALLTGFGFAGQVAGGKGNADMALGWPGSPAGFGLAAVQGTLKLDMRDGQLTEVKPGAGRVLGLLGVAQLPRRLTLDFHDFFDKGLAFDRIGGDIAFGNGVARSSNLAIDAPAADIRIAGAADLRVQTFDQTIDVFPKAGNLLTVAGAIAGGPIGAAIGAAANAVLHKPLGQMAAKTYHVTGPWKDPKVDVSSHKPTPQTQAKPPAPTPAPSPP